MAKRDGLSNLQMSKTRSNCFRLLRRTSYQDLHKIQKSISKAKAKALAVESKICRHLIITASRKMKSTPVLSYALSQFPLDKTMNVLIVGKRRTTRCHKLVEQTIKSADNCANAIFGKQTRASKRRNNSESRGSRLDKKQTVVAGPRHNLIRRIL